jgi:rhodanese-related sulfurtransferase
VDTATPSIPPAELNALVGRPGAPLVLDVRRRERFAESPHIVAGAQYCPPEEVAAFAARGEPRDVIVYCVHGHEVGRDAAAALRAAGWNARFLQDGIEGPGVAVRVKKRADYGVTGERPSRWITRARPKVDRVACPWLIRRFIDPRAEFFYVPGGEVLAEAQRLQAVPFDVDGVAVSHRWERCSFDALVEDFGLADPALAALAAIVRGADTARPALAPQCAGLLAFSLGLSRLHADDDEAMLAAAMPLYDALYAWCREAQGETHTWKAHA